MAEQHSGGYYDTPFLFTSKEKDDYTGLHYFGARYYDSRSSIWLSVDSLVEETIMNDEDWFLIEGFIQDINLVKKGLASDTFMNLINERLKEKCDSEETIQAIKNIA